MSILSRLMQLVHEPPPEFAFELSPAGLAWVRPDDSSSLAFAPLPLGTLQVNPLEDNVKDAAALARVVEQVSSQNGNRKVRPAALVLPDFCSRVTVLDFDDLPSNAEERQALVRFRIKKTLPFDVDAAVLSFVVQSRPHTKKLDVVVAAVSMEVAARYEQPFRQAGYDPGLVTVSALSALALGDDSTPATPTVVVKRTGRVLSLSVLHEDCLRFFRCLELDQGSTEEILDVLYPTFALIEDEFGKPAQAVRICGMALEDAAELERVLQMKVTRARSRYGTPGEYNAGLYGLLEAT